ncbi:MAG: hypothetical protein OXT09_07030 [Myxococcales bacterium]|nr:hypothetical protein [Myxococcales bacterium]
MIRARLLAGALIGLGAWSCTSRVDVVAVQREAARGLDAGPDDAGAGGDADVDGGDVDASADAGNGDGDGEDAGACDPADGTAVSLAGGRGLAALAGDARSMALCSCDGFSSSAPVELRTSAGSGVASAGVDGSMSLGDDAAIDGDLRVSGPQGLTLGELLLNVGGSLQVAGDVLGADATVEVGGDVAGGGRIQLASLQVGGVLRQPAGAELELGGGPVPAATEVGEVLAPTACPCDDTTRLDPASLAALGAAPVESLTFEEPCARLELDSIGPDPTRVRVEQSALVVLDGDLAINGELVIEVATGQTLDLLVTGNVRVDGLLHLGGSAEDATAGGQVRLFVAGAGTIELRGGGALHGVLHAPDAELVLPAPLTIHGSALLRRVAAEAELVIEH